ncbi:MoaD/ThiS family protein [Flavobacterium psychrotolerans]|uniref:MoaD/ThiS family protein n=1 Tax=Flavobacterium psychrotolerans TaxID=2169410 RepID=A0A2U1JHH5_9FLAO|nr:MoaD/ThiS family protein [Flavobacterium psychrotolerans]PWA04620.1 MoaD/ThiS family protein [Flavobacterium psychrotolerans]
MIAVKYFGMIAEKTKTEGEEFSFSGMQLVDLLSTLEQKYQLGQLSFSVAINQKIVQDTADYKLKSNDIIALLPPFAGG